MFSFWEMSGTPDDEGNDSRIITRAATSPDDTPEETSAPAVNERVADESGERVGTVVRRQTQSFTVQKPTNTGPWVNHSMDGLVSNDAAFATKGIYAAREVAGTAGHPGMWTSIALEPTIRDEAVLGGITQAANARVVHDTQVLSANLTNGETWAAQMAAVNPFASANAGSLGGLFV